MLFGHEQRGRWLLNIGGMANVTWVPRRGVPEAHSLRHGPGVAVIDAITRRVDPMRVRRGRERARRGRPVAKLLDELLADPYFDQPPPKSTGRERFGIEYADKLLKRVKQAGGSDNDAIATATALTAETISRGVASHEDEIVVSGGGARNPALIERLVARVQPRPVVMFEQLFFNGEAKEAVAFAFLRPSDGAGQAGQSAGGDGGGARAFWAYHARMIAGFTRFSRFRRWGYTLFLIVGVLGIPAQAHFRLYAPFCDLRMAWDNSRLSLMKVPHFVLFGVFFLFTAWQFARLDRRSLSWSLVATLALGILVELEEGRRAPATAGWRISCPMSAARSSPWRSWCP